MTDLKFALPVDVTALAAEALQSFPMAMRDDPNLWPSGGAPMPNEVSAAVNETVRDNFRSLLARRIGAHIQNAASDMDAAVSEDGPLADLSGVWATYVTGLDLEDLETVRKAKDWDARIEALKDLVIPLIQGLPAPQASKAQVEAYIVSEPRLADLAVSLKHETAAPVAEPEPVKAAFSWEDEETEAAAETGAGTAPGGESKAPWPGEAAVTSVAPALPVGDVRPTPLLFHLLEPIGVLLTDVADVTGIAKPTLSNIRNGKRPWGGLTEKQAHKLADELDQRAAGAVALSRRLRALEPAVVDGNRA